jgi:hypothetical protein
MLSRDDEWFDRMPWVPAMPGNKTYVLWEAQKEIERLRKEIKRLRHENQELRDSVAKAKEPQESAVPPEPQGGTPEGDAIKLRIGVNLVVMGVIKILGQTVPLFQNTYVTTTNPVRTPIT